MDQDVSFVTNAAPPARLAYTVENAAELASVSRSTLYEVIASGDLPVRKIGRRTVILADDLKEWLRSLPARPSACASLDKGGC